MQRLRITFSAVMLFFVAGAAQVACAQSGDGNSWFPWSQQNMASSEPGMLRRGWNSMVAGPKYVYNKTSTATSSAWNKTRDALNPWKEEPAPAPWEPKKKKETKSWSLWPWSTEPERKGPQSASDWIALPRPS
jgi:hypothetical protein